MKNNKGVKLDTLPPVDRLTPVEAKIWEMRQAGKEFKEIGLELNMKPISARRRMTVIKEKLACQ